MEVARTFEESSSSYPSSGMSRRFVIAATSVILAAAVFGGTVGKARKFSRSTSAGMVNPYRAADDI
jgi:hypothetical protein